VGGIVLDGLGHGRRALQEDELGAVRRAVGAGVKCERDPGIGADALEFAGSADRAVDGHRRGRGVPAAEVGERGQHDARGRGAVREDHDLVATHDVVDLVGPRERHQSRLTVSTIFVKTAGLVT
jgi:hypothetical protein